MNLVAYIHLAQIWTQKATGFARVLVQQQSWGLQPVKSEYVAAGHSVQIVAPVDKTEETRLWQEQEQ